MSFQQKRPPALSVDDTAGVGGVDAFVALVVFGVEGPGLAAVPLRGETPGRFGLTVVGLGRALGTPAFFVLGSGSGLWDLALPSTLACIEGTARS